MQEKNGHPPAPPKQASERPSWAPAADEEQNLIAQQSEKQLVDKFAKRDD